MDKSRTHVGRVIVAVLGRAGLCALLSLAALLSLRAVDYLLASRERVIDFSPPRKAAAPPARGPESRDTLRFAVATMVSAEETFSTYRHLVRWTGQKVGRQHAFVVRPSYTDVRLALEAGSVDVALVCTGTYVHSRAGKRIELLVQPEFRKGLSYRCLFLVAADSSFQNVKDLRGAVMAMTDKESNTGCLVPCAMLAERGHDPRTYFRKVVFTRSHDRSILAVAKKLAIDKEVVDVAAVDALVWESNRRALPVLSDKVRVLWQSEEFGPPPIVVPAGLDPELKRSLREAFLTMHKDEQGEKILKAIGIRRFVPADPKSYLSAVALLKGLDKHGGLPWP